MKNIKYLERELISQGKELLENYWGEVNIDSTSSPTSVDIKFKMGKASNFSLYISLLPLDMPWRISSKVVLEKKEIGDIEKVIYNEINEESKYELYPFLLNDESKINRLTHLMLEDLKTIIEKEGFSKKRKSRFLLDE